jgi:hypothetical protein
MPNISQLKKSNFLTQNDCDPPIKVTISGWAEKNVAQAGAEPDERIVLLFNEVEKPLVLNSTNGNIIAAITGTGEIENWNGTVVVLYKDPTIQYGGKLVGGIRVRAPKAGAAKPNPAMKAKPKPELEVDEVDPNDPNSIPF